MDNYISIDIGGTAIKYGIIRGDGTISYKAQMDTQAYKGGPAILEKVVNIVERYMDTVHPKGICISTAGMVDTRRGEIFYAAPLIPDYAGTNFKETLEKAFHIPCEVENDVNCAGLAESVSGAAQGAKVALCLTIGTGIGGSIIIDGKIFHGGAFSACEVGYMSLGGSDFQTLGASSILTKKVAARKGDPVEKWNGYRIFEDAKAGDPDCIQAIDEMVDVLGEGIANICYVVNPEIIVLGGGIMAQEAYLEERLKKSVFGRLVPGIAQNTRLAFAQHKNDAGMMGAFYHFMQKHKG